MMPTRCRACRSAGDLLVVVLLDLEQLRVARVDAEDRSPPSPLRESGICRRRGTSRATRAGFDALRPERQRMRSATGGTAPLVKKSVANRSVAIARAHVGAAASIVDRPLMPSSDSPVGNAPGPASKSRRAVVATIAEPQTAGREQLRRDAIRIHRNQLLNAADPVVR
jgi:hypothetical protein